MNKGQREDRAARERAVFTEEEDRIRKLFPGMAVHVVTRDDVEEGFSEEMVWKNFVIGNEIDIAANMIYGACQKWMTTTRIERDSESRIYGILYGWSAGFERVGKALLALKGVEHDVLKKSIKHFHRGLWDKLEEVSGPQPAHSHRLMQLCETFYNRYRYSGLNVKAESQRDIAALAWGWVVDTHAGRAATGPTEVRKLTKEDRQVTIGALATYGGWLVGRCWEEGRNQGLFLNEVPSWYKSNQLRYEGEAGRNGRGIILEPYLKNAVITEIEERVEGAEKEKSWLANRTIRELLSLWDQDEVLFDIRDEWEDQLLEHWATQTEEANRRN